MLTSLYSGISGLLANSEALDIVGNNISNSNTTGFKSSSASFEDVLYQTITGTSGTGQVGTGAALGAVKTDFSEGSIETTDSATDLAIGGQGFFIVKKPGDSTDYYTRAGGFSLNTAGNMVDANGDLLQGKVMDQTTGTATGVDTNINISQQPSQPKPTQTLNMVVNLESDSAWKGECTVTGGASITNIAAASGCYPATGAYTLSVTGPAGTGLATGTTDYPVSLTIPNSSGSGTTTIYGTATSNGTVADFVGNTAADGSGTSVDTGLALTFGTLSCSVTAGTVISAVAQVSGKSPASGDYTYTVGALASGSYPVTLNLPDGSAVYGSVTTSGTVADFVGNTAADGSGNTVDTGLALTIPTVGAGSGAFTVPSSAFTLSGFDGTSATTQSNTSNYSSSETVYDSLGTAHTVTVDFRKASVDSTSQTSTWDWNVTVSGGDTVVSGGSGAMTFNENGVLTSGGTPQTVTFDFVGAQQNQAINLVLGSTSGEGSSTQYSSASTTTYVGQDGYAPGVLQSISVSNNGIISGTYDNGQILQLYQLTLASFNNPQGLKKEGGNLYAATLDSGAAYTNAPGQGGTGTISSNSLEESNVDLASEFVNMIIYQNGYEANSKVITTTDQILQDLLNIIPR